MHADVDDRGRATLEHYFTYDQVCNRAEFLRHCPENEFLDMIGFNCSMLVRDCHPWLHPLLQLGGRHGWVPMPPPTCTSLSASRSSQFHVRVH